MEVRFVDMFSNIGAVVVHPSYTATVIGIIEFQ